MGWFLVWLTVGSIASADLGHPANSYLQRFRTEEKAVSFFPLSELESQFRSDELTDPKTKLPNLEGDRAEELSELRDYQDSCIPPKKRSPRFRKAWTWRAYLCGKYKRLPVGFLHTTPHMDPLGKSYASMVLGGQPKALFENRYLLHLLEWKEVLKTQELSRKERIWAGIDSVTLQALKAESPVAFSKDLVWFISSKRLDSTSMVEVYSRTNFDPMIERSPYQIEVQAIVAERCLAPLGFYCWTDRPKYWENRNTFLMVSGVVTGSMVLLFILVFAAFQVRRSFRANQERKFLLETLSHELRTPVTGINLSLETFRREFDQFSDEVQTSFMRLCDDVGRLNRVVEASQAYLSHRKSNRKPLKLQIRNVPSIREFLEAYVSESTRELELRVVGSDVEVSIDPNWLRICLDNLVENAFVHGKPPVWIEMNTQGRWVEISVCDRGKVSESYRMIKPFKKGEKSPGWGLGLTISSKAIEEMGGKLKFEREPTKFVLRLGRLK